jgi:K+ transporter
MMVLATLAAIVASQAVITGTFSILRQVGLRVALWRSKGGEILDKTLK